MYLLWWHARTAMRCAPQRLGCCCEAVNTLQCPSTNRLSDCVAYGGHCSCALADTVHLPCAPSISHQHPASAPCMRNAAAFVRRPAYHPALNGSHQRSRAVLWHPWLGWLFTLSVQLKASQQSPAAAVGARRGVGRPTSHFEQVCMWDALLSMLCALCWVV